MAKGEIIIFQHRDFRGHHRHIFDQEPNLNRTDDNTLNDAVSSFIVLKGTWKLYRHKDYQIAYDKDFPPGQYRWVRDHDIENDDMSSLKCIKE